MSSIFRVGDWYDRLPLMMTTVSLSLVVLDLNLGPHYHFNHAMPPVLFALAIFFLDRVLHFLPGVGLGLRSTSLHLIAKNYRYILPCPACWLRWALANFFPGLTVN
jgi:hypothetical protein